jgi:hypothetical protein
MTEENKDQILVRQIEALLAKELAANERDLAKAVGNFKAYLDKNLCAEAVETYGGDLVVLEARIVIIKGAQKALREDVFTSPWETDEKKIHGIREHIKYFQKLLVNDMSLLGHNTYALSFSVKAIRTRVRASFLGTGTDKGLFTRILEMCRE